ncbi:MAG TPA: PfkB family carbohydrate kinase [Thermodesulfobacteriota bacterium]|nr:PfkB family carbohydrate kinase [Thermodesulfobacteriota bacterium]
MSVLVVGSVALDTIETPFGNRKDVLGGSASYFSFAASLFTDVKIVAVVGDDFPEEHMQLFRSRRVDLKGLQKAQGRTFRWHGRYGYDLGEPETIGTYLNVFKRFDPVMPDGYRDSEYVFLANIDPELQLNVLKQVKKPRVVACDTMNYWIENKPQELKEVLKHVNIFIVNDSETRELAKEPRIIRAARDVLDMGPDVLIVKRGEYGALMFSKEGIFWSPSYPLEEVIDPTGAGDTFAGGFMGYIASNNLSDSREFRRAVIHGSVVASFTVEDFSLNRLASLEKSEIETRFEAFLKLSRLD